MKAPQPRKSLSRAVRNYLALHSYTAERRGEGLYNIFDAEGGWLGEILYCYSVEEIIEIIGGLVIGGFDFPQALRRNHGRGFPRLVGQHLRTQRAGMAA